MPVIGVALSIPEPWATELQDYRTGLDPAAALVPTHITLIPPTDIDDDTLTVVEGHLDKVAEAGAAFDVHLRGTGTFRPVSPVVFISLAAGISQTEQTIRELQSITGMTAADETPAILGADIAQPAGDHNRARIEQARAVAQGRRSKG